MSKKVDDIGDQWNVESGNLQSTHASTINRQKQNVKSPSFESCYRESVVGCQSYKLPSCCENLSKDVPEDLLQKTMLLTQTGSFPQKPKKWWKWVSTQNKLNPNTNLFVRNTVKLSPARATLCGTWPRSYLDDPQFCRVWAWIPDMGSPHNPTR